MGGDPGTAFLLPRASTIISKKNFGGGNMRIGKVVRGLLVPPILLLPLFGCEAMQAVDRGLYSATNAVSQRDRITGERDA